MRTTKIISGAFTEKGNFSGYNGKGERIFVHKRTMESLGLTKNEDLKKDNKFQPLFAIIDEKAINPVNTETGQVDTTVTVQRLQALSIFLTQEELIDAKNSDALMEIESQKQLSNAVSSAGLTQAQLDVILSASI